MILIQVNQGNTTKSESVVINASLILSMAAYQYGGTEILFNNGSVIRVTDSLKEVVDKANDPVSLILEHVEKEK